jgi:hypothetical protein
MVGTPPYTCISSSHAREKTSVDNVPSVSPLPSNTLGISQRLSAKQKSISQTDFQPYWSLAPRLPQPVALFKHGTNDTAGTASNSNTWGLQAQSVTTGAICLRPHHGCRSVQGEGISQTDCASPCHESSACQIFDLEFHAKSGVVDSQSTSPPATALVLRRSITNS